MMPTGNNFLRPRAVAAPLLGTKISSTSHTAVLAFLTHDGNRCSGGVGGLPPGSSVPASGLTASLCSAGKWYNPSQVPASPLNRPHSVSIFSITPSSSMSVSSTCPRLTGGSVMGWKVLVSKCIIRWKELAPDCGWL